MSVEKDDRAQFKVPKIVRAAVQEVAEAEDLPESAVWRRVVLAGLSALGVELPGPAVRVEPVRTLPPSPQPSYSSEPAGWDEPDPLDSIA